MNKSMNIIFQFKDLESLGYQSVAFGFHGGDVELVGTSSALRKIEGEDEKENHKM